MLTSPLRHLLMAAAAAALFACTSPHIPPAASTSRATMEKPDPSIRETRGTQISFESRLLLIPNTYLDDLRIGWDLTLPDGGTVPSTKPAATPPNLHPAEASIIDNHTLQMLLNAAQADRRTVSFTNPRQTVFNGRQAMLSTGALDWSLSSDLGDIHTAVTLNVTPTLSADRRYVVMALDAIRTDNAPKTIPAPKPATPATQHSGINTFVSIPDRGTLLINLHELPGDPQKRTALFLIRPSIVNEREIENDLYGFGDDHPTSLPPAVPVGASLKTSLQRDRTFRRYKQTYAVGDEALAKRDYKTAIRAGQDAIKSLNDTSDSFSDIEMRGLRNAAQDLIDHAQAAQTQQGPTEPAAALQHPGSPPIALNAL